MTVEKEISRARWEKLAVSLSCGLLHLPSPIVYPSQTHIGKRETWGRCIWKSTGNIFSGGLKYLIHIFGYSVTWSVAQHHLKSSESKGHRCWWWINPMIHLREVILLVTHDSWVLSRVRVNSSRVRGHILRCQPRPSLFAVASHVSRPLLGGGLGLELVGGAEVQRSRFLLIFLIRSPGFSLHSDWRNIQQTVVRLTCDQHAECQTTTARRKTPRCVLDGRGQEVVVEGLQANVLPRIDNQTCINIHLFWFD